MDTRTAVVSALLGVLATTGAALGVRQMVTEEEGARVPPSVTHRAWVTDPRPSSSPATTAPAPAGPVEGPDGIPAGEVGDDLTAPSVPAPPAPVETPGAAEPAPPATPAPPLPPVPSSRPDAGITEGSVLPGLAVEGLGEVLRAVPPEVAPDVTRIMGQIPASAHEALGRLLSDVPSEHLDEVAAMFDALSAGGGPEVAAFLRTSGHTLVRATGALLRTAPLDPFGELGTLAVLAPVQAGAVGEAFATVTAGAFASVAGVLTAVQPDTLPAIADLLQALVRPG
ncbi:MAG: hypothetical protein ACRDY7_09260 [Acidimicrobiia bacterium]